MQHLESHLFQPPLRWGPPLPLLHSPPRLPPPLLPPHLLALCPRRSPLLLRLNDDREDVLVSGVLSHRINPFKQNPFGCAQLYRRLPPRRHPSPPRKPQRLNPAPLCHLCRSHPGTLAGVEAWKRCLCIRSGLSLRNWTDRGFSECPNLSVKRQNKLCYRTASRVVFCWVFLATCTRGKTHQWFYCTEVFNLVATKVEMCEVGAFLCQNFQPPWDPVIAEFKLPDKSTVKRRETRNQQTPYLV